YRLLPMGHSLQPETGPQPLRRPWVLNAAGLFLTVCWLALVAWTLTPEVDDFAQLRRGAVDLREHNDPYYTRSDPAAQAQRRSDMVDEPGERGFKYTPVFAYLFGPFALLDHRAGQLIWFALNLAALIALIVLCVGMSGSVLARRYWGVLLFAMALAP